MTSRRNIEWLMISIHGKGNAENRTRIESYASQMFSIICYLTLANHKYVLVHSILVWSFPRMVSRNCEEKDLIESLLKLIAKVRNLRFDSFSYMNHIYLYNNISL